MSKELAVLATVAAGGMVAAQAPVNNILSKKVGTFGAVSVNFFVGTMLVLLITFAFAGGIQNIEGFESPPWYYWFFGGLAGVGIVPTTLVTVRELGAEIELGQFPDRHPQALSRVPAVDHDEEDVFVIVGDGGAGLGRAGRARC